MVSFPPLSYAYPTSGTSPSQWTGTPGLPAPEAIPSPVVFLSPPPPMMPTFSWGQPLFPPPPTGSSMMAGVSPVQTVAQATPAKPIKEVKASHILVENQQEAWKLRQQILSGQRAFEAVAKQVSKCPSGKDGGDLGFFERGQMVPEFDKAAFKLPVGVVSEPIKTDFGWHLIKVTQQR